MDYREYMENASMDEWFDDDELERCDEDEWRREDDWQRFCDWLMDGKP